MSTAFLRTPATHSNDRFSTPAPTLRFRSEAAPPAAAASPSDATVVLLGETGDVEGVVAQELARQGFRLQTYPLDQPAAATAPPAVRALHAALRQRPHNLGKLKVLIVDGAPPSAAARSRDVLALGDLSLDRGRREVRVGGVLVDLTKTEFDVLYVLVSEPGIVFTRDQIVTASKGSGYPVTLRSVDVQLVGLRRKLGPVGRRLQTIRGVGYRFLENASG